MRYIYGPVKSRRLGLSLGVSLTPYKICTFDCIYCQLGSVTESAAERIECVPAQDILGELKAWMENNPAQASELDYITLSGAGEPTLNKGMGRLIEGIHKLSSSSVAVITNASLLSLPEVRRELSAAELVVPSLDAVTAQAFNKINRPAEGIKIEDIINGLIAFRGEFKGRIWLEVMLVKGINDGLDAAARLKDIIDRIKPDKIHINSPVRFTAENNIAPVDDKRLREIKGILGDKCEIA